MRHSSTLITHGKSPASVVRVSGERTFYCKTTPLRVATPSWPTPLLEEKRRYEWLKGRVPVPDVIAYEQSEEEERLLLAEVIGLPAFDSHFEHRKETVVTRLAEGLRLLHSIPIDDCPFDMRLDTRVAMAEANAAARRVDLDDLQPEHKGWTAEMLLDEVRRTRPASEDLVVTHGDYCLPNIILSHDASEIAGFIDVGYCGVADRYQDLALAWRSIRYNLGEPYVPMFFEAYGVPEPDVSRIAFSNLLDELF